MTYNKFYLIFLITCIVHWSADGQDLAQDLAKMNEIFKAKQPFSFVIEQNAKFRDAENNQTTTIKYIVSAEKMKFVSKQIEGLKTPSSTVILNHLLQQCYVLKARPLPQNDASQMLGMEQIAGVKLSNFTYTYDNVQKLKTYFYFDQKTKSTYSISFDGTTNFLRRYYFKNDRIENGPKELSLEVSAYSTKISVKPNEFDPEQYIKEESGRMRLQSKYHNYQIIN